jgi:hypothetical protein
MQYAFSLKAFASWLSHCDISDFASDILQGSPRICTCEALLGGKITGIGDGALLYSSSIIIH